MNLLIDNYRQIAETLRGRDLECLTVAELIEQDPADGFFVLRHDVEADPRRALAMAEVETSLGLRGTFYFHGPNRARVYHPELMLELQRMGHEVGYHYETLDRAKGDFERARALFAKDLATFRDAGIDLKTVVYHGNPRVNKVGYRTNGAIVENDPGLLAASDLLADAEISVDIASFDYVVDLGIRLATLDGPFPDGVLAYFEAPSRRRYYMLTHPDYWSGSTTRAVALRSLGQAMRTFTPVAKLAWIAKDRVSR